MICAGDKVSRVLSTGKVQENETIPQVLARRSTYRRHGSRNSIQRDGYQCETWHSGIQHTRIVPYYRVWEVLFRVCRHSILWLVIIFLKTVKLVMTQTITLIILYGLVSALYNYTQVCRLRLLFHCCSVTTAYSPFSHHQQRQMENQPYLSQRNVFRVEALIITDV